MSFQFFPQTLHNSLWKKNICLHHYLIFFHWIKSILDRIKIRTARAVLAALEFWLGSSSWTNTFPLGLQLLLKISRNLFSINSANNLPLSFGNACNSKFLYQVILQQNICRFTTMPCFISLCSLTFSEAFIFLSLDQTFWNLCLIHWMFYV